MAHSNRSSIDSEFVEDSLSASETSDGSWSVSEEFPYSPRELAIIFEEFYEVLTTLYFEPSELKMAPLGGWPHMTNEFLANFKSLEAMQVVRYLPYFHSPKNIHYKSKFIDFSSKAPDYFASRHNAKEWRAEFRDEDGLETAHAFCFAAGFESYGRDLTLDIKNGVIIEDQIRAGPLDPKDAREFFNDLAEDFRTLRLIYCPGREMLEVGHIEEVDEIITEERWRSQIREKKGFGTDLDIQYLRQVYRQHGWPDAFRKEECWQAVGAMMDSMEDECEVWEEDFHWHDAENWE